MPRPCRFVSYRAYQHHVLQICVLQKIPHHAQSTGICPLQIIQKQDEGTIPRCKESNELTNCVKESVFIRMRCDVRQGWQVAYDQPQLWQKSGQMRRTRAERFSQPFTCDGKIFPTLAQTSMQQSF